MRRFAVLVLAGMVSGFLMSGTALAKDEASGTSKTTIKGMAKAIGIIGKKPNPSIANATLTVKVKVPSQGTGTETYYVYGWAGVILAMKADGKEAEVNGVIGEKDGKKTITGKSIDVKIEGVAFEKPIKSDKK